MNIDFASQGLAGKECVFICRKAIGYLDSMPEVVSRFLVSALRSVECDARDAISDLLLDPILINSRGEARAYLGPRLRLMKAILRRVMSTTC